MPRKNHTITLYSVPLVTALLKYMQNGALGEYLYFLFSQPSCVI